MRLFHLKIFAFHFFLIFFLLRELLVGPNSSGIENFLTQLSQFNQVAGEARINLSRSNQTHVLLFLSPFKNSLSISLKMDKSDGFFS